MILRLKSFSAPIAGLLAASLYSGNAAAFTFSWNDFDFELNNRLTVGAGWRLEERDVDLLGKLNVPGQQDLCRADDCLSFEGDPEPARRLANARGGHFLHATDDGNMNYDKGDMYISLARIDSDFTANWRDYVLKVTGIAYYDPVNADLEETNFDTTFQPRKQERRDRIQERLSEKVEIREAFLFGTLPFFGDRELGVTIGNQRIRWGEANLHLFNTLDLINPLDATLARQPGLDLSKIQLPTGMLTLSTDINDSMSVEAFYQYDWDPVRPDPSGSYFSTFDPAGGGDYVNVHLGQFNEDPFGRYESQGLIGLLSSTTTTISLEDENQGFPEDGGQYGIKLSWYAEDFLNGTEFGFYYANYHNRLPLASGRAAQYSCTRDALIPGDLASAALACNGFNGSINATGLGREPFPVDTAEIFLDYPEDNQTFGVSFNATVGLWSVSGEYAYHKDQPVQLLLSDVLFALEQNAAPEQDIPIGPGALLSPAFDALPAPLGELVTGIVGGVPLAGLTFPGRRSIFPDFITQFRGRVPLPGEYVPGFERLDVNQLVINGIRIFSSSNPLKADQILVLLEAGATYVRDMPEQGELYFQGAGDFTHPTPGSDGSGQPAGEPINSLSINPRQQKEGFADDFSWGTRFLVQATYNDLWGTGVNLLPTMIGFVDIEGIAPFPAQNYVEDNMFIIPGFFFEYGQAWSGSVLYQYHSGERNLLRDRDNISFSLSYSF